jgi:phosphoglycerate dehydrogenase-like enzyme
MSMKKNLQDKTWSGGEDLETDVMGFLGVGEVAYAFSRDLSKKECRVFAYDHNIDPKGMRGFLKQTGR